MGSQWVVLDRLRRFWGINFVSLARNYISLYSFYVRYAVVLDQNAFLLSPFFFKLNQRKQRKPLFSRARDGIVVFFQTDFELFSYLSFTEQKREWFLFLLILRENTFMQSLDFSPFFLGATGGGGEGPPWARVEEKERTSKPTFGRRRRRSFLLPLRSGIVEILPSEAGKSWKEKWMKMVTRG